MCTQPSGRAGGFHRRRRRPAKQGGAAATVDVDAAGREIGRIAGVAGGAPEPVCKSVEGPETSLTNAGDPVTTSVPHTIVSSGHTLR